jgi:glutamate-1-semialdehyde 2,1-aminomutase
VHVGSIFWVAFSEKESIVASSDIDDSKMSLFKQFHGELLERGVYIGPSGFEVGFISRAHTMEDIEKAITEMNGALKKIFG